MHPSATDVLCGKLPLVSRRTPLRNSRSSKAFESSVVWVCRFCVENCYNLGVSCKLWEKKPTPKYIKKHCQHVSNQEFFFDDRGPDDLARGFGSIAGSWDVLKPHGHYRSDPAVADLWCFLLKSFTFNLADSRCFCDLFRSHQRTST